MRTSPTSSPPPRRPDKRVVVPIAIVAIVAGLLLGGAFRLLTGDDGPGAIASGTPGPTAAVASTTPSVGPSGIAPPPSSAPSAAPTQAGSSLTRGALPIRGEAIGIANMTLMAPTSDGGLYLAVPGPGEGITTVALLDRTGMIRPGWPALVRGTDYCRHLLAAPDGSARLICERWSTEYELGPPISQFLAFDAAARPLPAWPLEIEEGVMAASMIGNDLDAVLFPYQGDTFVEGGLEDWHVTRIAPSGTPRTGTTVPIPCCPNPPVVGPTGTVYQLTIDWEAETARVGAFRLDGQRPGSPVTIEGMASDPAFDGLGQANLFVRGRDGAPNRVYVIDGDGRVRSSLPLEGITSSSLMEGAESDQPAPPIVATDGTMFVIEDTAPGTRVIALRPGGGSVLGSPYRSDLGPQYNVPCVEGDTGCPSVRTAAAVGPGNVLYMAHAAGPGIGGSIVAIDGGGRVIDGWPVGLRRAGAEVWSLATAPDGTVWALVFEPEGRGHSATLLAIAPDSTVRGTLTIVEP